MPDAAAEPDTAAGRAAAQETSALSHPAVDPDATAGTASTPTR